jgi:hypothetical protein
MFAAGSFSSRSLHSDTQCKVGAFRVSVQWPEADVVGTPGGSSICAGPLQEGQYEKAEHS